MNVEKFTNKKLFKSVELIAFLSLRGFKWLGEPVRDGKYSWAAFEDTDALRQTVDEFYADSEARKLFDYHRRTKQYLMD